MFKIASALIVISAVAACAPTVSGRMDACVEQNHDWRASHHCQIDVLESINDPLAGVMRGFEELNDASSALLDENYKARKEGRISEYEFLDTVCAMSNGHGCAEVHTVTPDGETSDSIVTWSP